MVYDNIQLEYLTGCFQGRPSECAPRQLWDFAFSGADVDKNLWVYEHPSLEVKPLTISIRIPLHHNFSVDLVDQVREWALYGSDVIPHPAEETITAFWIGINDTGDTLNNSTVGSPLHWHSSRAHDVTPSSWTSRRFGSLKCSRSSAPWYDSTRYFILVIH